MTALKAHEVKRFLERPNLIDGVFLIYGPDVGLVHETAKELLVHVGKDSDITVLDGETVAKEPERIAIELKTVSMFGGRRVVRIRGAGKALAPIVKELGDGLTEAALVLEADNLLPKDALRAAVEGMKNGRALPCYADSEQTIGTLVKEFFDQKDIAIDRDVVPTLVSILGNDREVTRRELEKLALFAGTPGKLSSEEVLELCADNSMMAVDDVIDSAALGNIEELDRALKRAASNGIDVQRIIIMASSHFSALRRWKCDVDEGKGAAYVLDNAKPRPHFSRKQSLIKQLELWTEEGLSRACSRLYGAVRDSRKSSSLSSPVIEQSLFAIAQFARRQR